MTVEEALTQSGFTPEQIKALDPKAVTAFTNILSTADQARTAAQEAATKAEADRQAALAAKEAAELAQRSNVEFYESKIVPSLTGWEDEKTRLENARINAEAKAGFLQSQIEGAKAAGFLPAETPAFTLPTNNPGRDSGGRFVPNASGGTPGSPTFQGMDELTSTVKRAVNQLETIPDIQWKYQTLYGKPMPESPRELLQKAEAMKLSPADYAARQFNFVAREMELAKQADEAKAAQIRAEAEAPLKEQLKQAEIEKQKAVEENNRKWAEKIGNNPDVRIAQPSRFADVARAVKANERPDPLTLTDQQRRQATTAAIRQEISESSAA